MGGEPMTQSEIELRIKLWNSRLRRYCPVLLPRRQLMAGNIFIIAGRKIKKEEKNISP